MYPAAELTDLARRKVALRVRISLERLRCAEFAGEVVRPLNWLDRVIEQWRKIPPHRIAGQKDSPCPPGDSFPPNGDECGEAFQGRAALGVLARRFVAITPCGG
jgi:hypothetical protein